MEENSDFVMTAMGYTRDLKAKHEIKVKCFHCGNAGENNAFENLCKEAGLDIFFNTHCP